ncbi:MAG: hypothetical protein R3F43_04230 [bacterium]
MTLGNGLSLLLEISGGVPALAVDGIQDGTSNTRGVVINHEEQFAPSVRALPSLAADLAQPDRAFIISSGSIFSVRLADAGARSTTVERLAAAPRVPPLAPVASGAGPQGALLATIDTGGRVLAYIEQDNLVSVPLDLPFPARDVAFQGDRLLVLSSVAPELAVVTFRGTTPTVRVHALTDAEPGSPEADGELPRQFLKTSGPTLIRRTNGKIMVIVVS